jgi:hypothetical protein
VYRRSRRRERRRTRRTVFGGTHTLSRLTIVAVRRSCEGNSRIEMAPVSLSNGLDFRESSALTEGCAGHTGQLTLRVPMGIGAALGPTVTPEEIVATVWRLAGATD